MRLSYQHLESVAGPHVDSICSSNLDNCDSLDGWCVRIKCPGAVRPEPNGQGFRTVGFSVLSIL
jgi:hypothetical protein